MKGHFEIDLLIDLYLKSLSALLFYFVAVGFLEEEAGVTGENHRLLVGTVTILVN